jgi:beta-glucanase (GH16 family)
VFEDEFNSGKLDRNKWLTRYFWGEVFLHDSYALPGEKHLFTDGKNLELSGSAVKIVTRSEKISGKEWIPSLGFYPKDFNYTSGIICSGSSYRTKYGKFEAKIKLDASKGVLHAFWLTGDTIVPQIDIFNCSNNKLFLSTFWGNPTDANGIQKDTASISASKFTGKFFIFSFEWTPDKMIWRINDVDVKTQTSNIPNEPLYVVFNSGVVGDQPQIPTRLEVDWIRCYQRI